MVLRDAMEDEGARQAGILLQRIQYLMDVGIIAPMVGLLGTVWGMMQSFSGLKSGISIVNKADALAAGVSTAMYTTFAGLFVGILAMIAYSVFRGRVNKLIGGIETACNRVLRRCVLNRQQGNY
jgi:biopolymer transport protein ExbB